MRKTLGEFLGALSDEVAKEVGFEAQPKPFDGIEIGAVARQVMNLEVMPVEDRPNSGQLRSARDPMPKRAMTPDMDAGFGQIAR